MAGPFDFGGGFNFGDPMGGSPFLPQPAVPRPQMSPQEEEALLGRLMEGGLGGLAYVGKVLDKTFGGRAVRGVLGGNPRELLSALPFSDTLGLTNEADTVSGHQLLQNAGVIDPGDDSFLGTALGIGAEIGLDPGSYVGAAVPKLLARGGKVLGRTAGAGLEAVAGVNPYTYAGRQIDAAKRPIKALFNTPTAGAWNEAQGLAEGVFTPELRAGQSAAAMNAADANVRLSGYARRVPEPQSNEFNWALTQQAEGQGTDALNRLNKLGFTPGEAQDILGIGDQLGTRVRSLAGQERGLGLQSKVLEDLPEWQRVANEEALANGLPAPHAPQAQYAPRTLANFDEASDFSRRASDRLAGGSEFQTSREDFLRGIPGGTAKLDEFARDPRLSGAQRTLSDTDAEQLLASHILGQPAGAIPLNHPVYDQAKELGGFLKSMRPEVQQTGLFNPDLVGNVAAREMDSARRVAGAKTTLAAMDPARGFVKPVAELEAAGQRYVRVPDLLNAQGLSHVDANGTPVAAETVAKLLGIDVTQPGALQQLKDFAIPADAAADLQRVGQAWQTPAVVKPVVDMYDKFTSIFKSNLTSPFPGFHFRNLMSGIFNMWRDGAASPAAGVDMLKLLRGGSMSDDAAAKLFPGMPAGQASNEFLKELLGGHIAFTRSGQTAEQMGPRAALSGGMLAKDVPEVGGAVRPLGEDLRGFAQSVTPERGKLGQQLNPLNPEEFLPVQAGQKLGNTVEDWIRGTHYLAKRLEGLDPAAAKLQTMKYQIDYGDLTQFEKNVMKRLFPWYTFCVPTEYEILTQRGWKTHDQLTIGEPVLSLDHESGGMEWVPVEAVNVFDYEGPMACLESRGAKWLSTPNHNWPVITRKCFVKGKEYGGERKFVTSEKLNTNHSIPRTGEFCGTDSILAPRLASILGWVITDGYARWKGNHCEMVIYQSELKHLRVVEALLGSERRPAADRRVGRTNGAEANAPVHTVPVRIEDVRALSAVYRERADLPGIVGRLSREAAEAMYQAMMLADGSVSEIGQEFFAQTEAEPHVRDAFQIICYLTGRSTQLGERGCYVASNRVMKVVDWRGRPEHYNGKVWCPTTKHGTWVMRHKGKAAITGNSRKNLPPILEDLAQDPAKLAATARVTTGSREKGEFVPNYVAEGAATPIPGAPDGFKRFISSFGLPLEDEGVKTLGAIAQGDPKRTFQQLFGMAQPFVKLPAEIATGTQMYSGRKLEDLRPYEFTQLGGLLPEDVARKVSQVAANTPASRALSTVDKLIDERKGLGTTALNTLTGMRVTDVDLEKSKDQAAMQLLRDRLKGEPGVRSREEVYVSKDKLPALGSDDLMLYSLLQDLERRQAAKAREAKKLSSSP